METSALEKPSAFERASDELAMLRESALKFCEPERHVRRSRELRGTLPGYDRGVWSDIAAMGWLGILVPERHSGLGLGMRETAAVCEALGRALLPEPVTAASVLATGCLLYGSNEELKTALLPSFVDGRVIPAVAWREDGHEARLLEPSTTARARCGTVALSGTKRVVVGGAGADGYIVSAKSEQGLALYWVPKERAGAVSTIELADGRAAVELALDGVSISAEHRVAVGEEAAAALSRAYDEALIAISAELLGVMSRVFEITLAYLKTRVQFGRLIGTYQALQHRAVDLYAAQFMSRCTLEEVLAELATGTLSDAARGALASRLKARCADSSLSVAREAVQMHGAMGFSDECDVGLYLKRAIMLAAWLGGPDVHRRRYTQLAPREEEAEA